MTSLGIQNPTSREVVQRLAKVARAYGSTFFIIGTADFPAPEETLLFDTLAEAQRSLVGTFVRIAPRAEYDVTEYFPPEEVVFLVGESAESASDGLTTIKVATPTGEPLEDATAAAVALHDYVFAGTGALQLAKALGLVS